MYIGFTQEDTATHTWTKGGVVRLQTNESILPSNWSVSPLITGIGPVTTW